MFLNPRDSKIEVSIVIPTYNHCDDLLKPCLEKILAYTDMSKTEVIVVANGCTDNTREYIQEFDVPGVLFLWSDEPVGYTKATNTGIKHSTGEYIVLLNNDAFLQEQPKDQWIQILQKPFIDDCLVGSSGPLMMYDCYADRNVLLYFCVMIKRQMFELCGLLDEVYTPGGGEDIDFSARIEEAGYRNVVVPSPETLTWDSKVGINTGPFPIVHMGEATFSDAEIPEYGRRIIKENGLRNVKKYNKNICLSLGTDEHFKGYLSVGEEGSKAHLLMNPLKLDFDDNTISRIKSVNLLESLTKDEIISAINEWKRVLKPGGVLVIETVDTGALNEAFKLFKSTLPVDNYSIGTDEVKSLVLQAGFTEAGMSETASKRFNTLLEFHKSFSKGVLCSISTKGRTDSTLPLTLTSIALQTRLPDKVIIFDDNEVKVDLRNNPIYMYLFKLFYEKGVPVEVLFGECRGQHHNHQKANNSEYAFVWRIDDDEVAEANTLEVLCSYIKDENVGAVACAVREPMATEVIPNSSNKIVDIYTCPNKQWAPIQEVHSVDHLYSSYLYRTKVAPYLLALSPVAHREETIHSYSIKKAGYELLLVPGTTTYHFRMNSGGIRSNGTEDMFAHDEEIFKGCMGVWGMDVPKDNKVYMCSTGGIGDHFVLKSVLHHMMANNPSYTYVVGATYPDVFFDMKSDITVASVDYINRTIGDTSRFDLYKFMYENNWKESVEKACFTLYSNMYKDLVW